MKSMYLAEKTPIVGIKETFVNATKGWMLGERTYEDLWTDDRSKLFQSLKKEYGPIASPIYRDQLQVNGQMASIQVGYVFKGWQRYEDTREPYQREVWVEFLEQEDARI